MILDILYRLRTLFLLARTSTLNRQLHNKKNEQFKNFNELKKKFIAKYKKIEKEKEDKHVIAAWNEKNKRLVQAFLPYPPFDFLRNPIVLRTMFVVSGGKWISEELRFLEQEISKSRLKQLLEEDPAGGPLLLSAEYMTSHNSIHHLYHLQKFLSQTGFRFSNNQTIVEWGGGYGNFAKIVKRYNSNKNLTYILIDSPIFACIQWLYLTTVLESKNVHIIDNREEKIKKGLINVLPLGYLEFHKIKADLFISTWALSESSKFSQDYVIKHNWFGAKNFLLAFQKRSKSFPYADNIGKLLREKGSTIEEISFLPGNYYGFKT